MKTLIKLLVALAKDDDATAHDIVFGSKNDKGEYTPDFHEVEPEKYDAYQEYHQANGGDDRFKVEYDENHNRI